MKYVCFSHTTENKRQIASGIERQMESLLGELGNLKKRRTTYKRVTSEDDEKSSSTFVQPLVHGDGFLFQNSKLARVRDRLNEVCISHAQETQTISQTQIISNLYHGGKELEKNDILTISKQCKVPGAQAETQILPNSIVKRPEQATQEISDSIGNREEEEQAQEQEESLSKGEKFTQIITRAQQYDSVLDSYSKKKSTLNEEKESRMEMEIELTLRDDLELCRSSLKTKISDPQKGQPLQESEEDLAEHDKVLQKRARFSRESFLEDFDNSSGVEGDISDEDTEAPALRGIKNCATSPYEPTGSKKTKGQNVVALSAYEQELKRELDAEQCIHLCSDDEDDKRYEIASSLAAKATVLEIRARLSKQKPLVRAQGNCSNDLFYSLRKSTKKQILDYQKEIIERTGLKIEDIEKEKELIENLLDQEIARNKRIRLREIENEKKAAEGAVDENIGYSDNEISEPHLSEGDELNYYSNEVEDSGNDENDHGEAEKYEEDGTKEESDSQEKEDDIMEIRRQRRRKTKILADSESDGEEQTTLRNAINLGPYGNNLAAKTKMEAVEDGKHSAREYELSTESDGDINKESFPHMATEEAAKSKLRENKRRKKMAEMRARGITNVVEMEAEESEDEWYGVGGVDGELSDDYDSELERMIDDYSKTNSNPNEIRKLLVAENKEMDMKVVNKILYDIKNGGFRKRHRKQIQLELSDNEDDELESYRLRRREIMRKKRLQINDDDKKLIQNPKSQAFFESMVEDILEAKHISGPEDSADTGAGNEPDSKDSSEISERRKLVISHDFVQQSLSFLKCSKGSGEFLVDENAKNPQSGEGTSDLCSLKQDSTIKRLHKPPLSLSNLQKGKYNEEEQILTPGFIYPSVIKPFGPDGDLDNKFKEGRKTVTISKSYRKVGGNRTSVTYLTNMRKLVAPKKNNAKGLSGKPRTSGSRMYKLFDGEDDSFEK